MINTINYSLIYTGSFTTKHSTLTYPDSFRHTIFEMVGNPNENNDKVEYKIRTFFLPTMVISSVFLVLVKVADLAQLVLRLCMLTFLLPLNFLLPFSCLTNLKNRIKNGALRNVYGIISLDFLKLKASYQENSLTFRGINIRTINY